MQPQGNMTKAHEVTGVPFVSSPGFLPCLRYLSEKLDPTRAITSETLPEGLRVHHEPGLAFSSSDIAKVQRDEGGGFTVWANFLGLTDSQSPIPDYLAHDMTRCDDKAQRTQDYFNLFHHRIYELLFFGLQAQDLPLAWNRGPDQKWRRRVQALLGISAPKGTPQLGAAMISALSAQTPNARIIERAVAESLKPHLIGSQDRSASLKIVEFCGEQVELDPTYQNQLGLKNHGLGQDCVLGQRVTDRASKICVVIKNVDQTQIDAFAPQGPAHQQLKKLVDLLIHEPIAVELVLHLDLQAALDRSKNRATLGRAQQIMSYAPIQVQRWTLNQPPERA